MNNEWESDLETSLRPSSSQGPNIPSLIKTPVIGAARAGEVVASQALGGVVPSAAVGLTNLASTLATGEPLLPSWEEIYEKYVPTAKTLARGAEKFAKPLKVAGAMLNVPDISGISKYIPDIGPGAPPGTIRKEITEPLTQGTIEPGSGIENFVNEYASFLPLFANPSTWTSKAELLKDLAKAGAKATGIGLTGEGGELVAGDAGKALAEFGTLTTLGLWNRRGTVKRTMNEGFTQWNDFVTTSADQTISPDAVAKLQSELPSFLKQLRSGLGSKSPSKKEVMGIVNKVKNKLVGKTKSLVSRLAAGAKMKASELNEIRADINDAQTKVGRDGKASQYLETLKSMINDALGSWASEQGAEGSGAWEGLKEANNIFKGNLVTGKWSTLAEKYLQQGKLPYAAALFAVTSPSKAYKMFMTSPIRKIWGDVMWDSFKGSKKGVETSLAKFDKAIAKHYPNILSEGSSKVKTNVFGDWETN